MPRRLRAVRPSPARASRAGRRGARCLAGLALCAFSASGIAHGHALSAGYLELTPHGPDRWAVVLRPPKAAFTSQIRPEWPEHCRATPQPAPIDERRWLLTCRGRLETIGVTGFAGRAEEIMVRVKATSTTGPSDELYRLNDATPHVERPREPIDPGRWRALQAYFHLGVEHILAGYDHLSFIALLVLLVRRAPAIVGHLSLFTLAHSITLTLAALDVLVLPAAPTEVVIALSIAFAAREVLRPRRSPTVALTFGFGLLHGLGLAGALTEIGLPPHRQPEALLGFNLGVEAGQIACVALLGLGAMAGTRLLAARRPAFDRFAAYAIGGAAAYWVYARLSEMSHGV